MAYSNALSWAQVPPALTEALASAGFGEHTLTSSMKDALAYAYRNLELKLAAVVEHFVTAHFSHAVQDWSWRPKTVLPGVHEYIKELVRYGSAGGGLAVVLAASALPQELVRDIRRRYYSTIAQEVLNLLSRKKGPSFNTAFAQSLKADVEHVLNSVQRDEALRASLAEPVQLLTLLTAEKPAEFLEAKVRADKYASLRHWRRLQSVLGAAFMTNSACGSL